MQALTFQSLTFLLSFVFGVAALAVATQWTTVDHHRQTAWWLTGVAFTVGGILAVAQGFIAVLAFYAGPGTLLWDGFVRWAPVGNDGRALLKITFAALIVVLPLLGAKQIRSFRRLAVSLLLVGLLLGSCAGYLSTSLASGHQYTVMAFSSLALVIVLGVGLIIHLNKHTMDTLLWLCLCVYGFRLALGALWAGGWIPAGDGEVWEPSVWSRFAVDAVAYLAMLGLVVHYAVLQRRKVYVPALFESLLPPKPRFFGDRDGWV